MPTKESLPWRDGGEEEHKLPAAVMSVSVVGVHGGSGNCAAFCADLCS